VNKPNKITLVESLPLAVGSIIGSGILFLPSLTYLTSRNDVILSWLLTLSFVIPGIFYFISTVSKLKPSSISLDSVVELGLGKEIGNAVNFLLIGTVILGMPASTIIVGKYISEYFGLEIFNLLVPNVLLILAVVFNSFRAKLFSTLCWIITLALLLFSLALVQSTNMPIQSYPVFSPDFNFQSIASGTLLSFWAFAGFENLTFLYHEFKNPKKHLLLSSLISILVCGLLYIALVANYSALIPYYEIKSELGLMQILAYSQRDYLGKVLIGFSLLAVFLNLIAWTKGVDVIQKKIKLDFFPRLTNEGRKFTLLVIFLLSVNLQLAFQNHFNFILTQVSSNFLIVYLISIVACGVTIKQIKQRIVMFLMVFCILITLSTASYLLLYPFILFVLGIFLSAARAGDL